MKQNKINKLKLFGVLSMIALFVCSLTPFIEATIDKIDNYINVSNDAAISITELEAKGIDTGIGGTFVKLNGFIVQKLQSVGI